VNVDTIAASLGRSAAQVNRLGPKVCGQSPTTCYVQMKRVNSRSGSATMTAP